MAHGHRIRIGVIYTHSGTPTPRKCYPRLRMLSAIVGAAVVVAMAALTVAFGGHEAHAKVNIGGAGDTSTVTTPPSTPSISMAAPGHKAKGWKM
jgi:hypothetical protein